MVTFPSSSFFENGANPSWMEDKSSSRGAARQPQRWQVDAGQRYPTPSLNFTMPYG